MSKNEQKKRGPKPIVLSREHAKIAKKAMKDGLDKFESNSDFAKAIGVTPQAVNMRVEKGFLSQGMVMAAEAVTGIPRWLYRPDLYSDGDKSTPCVRGEMDRALKRVVKLKDEAAHIESSLKTIAKSL